MKYTNSQVKLIVDQLRSQLVETEVSEFKEAKNSFKDENLGMYFSALSNEANLKQCEYAWLIFGIENSKHNVVGTNYKNSRASLDELKKVIAEQTTGRVTFEEIYEIDYEGSRVVAFQIPPAPRGMPIAYKGHFYGREGESLGALNIQEIESIRAQVAPDWSREIVYDATINDLDAEAIRIARDRYCDRFPERREDVLSWSDEVFLDKAKITLKGKITKAAIVLLGKEESEALISPSVAVIKWILKDRDGLERDYEIFHCPLLLAVEKAQSKVRNLKYRYINPALNTIVPEEVSTYDSFVIREALNNAVAHQDYTLASQINFVEFEDKIVFANAGAFIPGSVANVLMTDSPTVHYRNTFLVNAMTNLKMVDTIGSGIKKMYSQQRERLFPLPSYEITSNLVSVTITGKIIDIDFSNLLARNKDLSLYDIELLNRVQYGKPISKDAVRYLRKKKLVEGRNPNLYIAKSLATKIGKEVEYSKNKGINTQKCEFLLLEALKDHPGLTKSDIIDLLSDLMPKLMDKEQISNRIGNILTRLRKEKKIRSSGQRRYSLWFLEEDK